MTGKSIAICVAVFGAGFVTGWAARALVKKKNEELNSEEVVHVEMDEDTFNHFDNIRQRYHATTFSISEKEAIEEANAEAESPSEDDDDDKDDIRPLFDYDGSEEDDEEEDDDIKPLFDDNYEDYIDYKPTNPYGEDPEDYQEEGNAKVHKKNVWPYEITLDDFESHNGYTKSTLEYYKNNVLIDEDGSEITNAGSIIGSGVLKNLLVSKGTAYVRNENLEIDYEIAFINENYERYDDDWDE